MNEILKLLLSLSLSGSILAVFLFAMKPLIKNKLSKSIQYYLWVIVLLRLILPFSFEGSIMNDIFYGDPTAITQSVQREIQPMGETIENSGNKFLWPNVEKDRLNGVYGYDRDHSRYIQDLFNQYILNFWLVGVMIVLANNLIGYARFLKYLKKANRPASEEENRILMALLKRRKNVRLLHNSFVSTPLLIGVFRPCIIIPDVTFSEKQLKNILIHEITHLERFDIGVKWLMMISTSIHWFNPLMYFIRKEINRACELACDEAVIKNFDATEKQAYGDTLISVVAEQKYPAGVLQATMCEEKRSLKERLIAIMKHHKKSRVIIIFSVVLLGILLFGAFYLGAGVGIGKDASPELDIRTEEGKTKAGSVANYNGLVYDLTDISKYKTAYVGDSSKVSAIAGRLPVPHRYFKQQYISMKTEQKPYGLTVYYEAATDNPYNGEWPIVTPDSIIEINSRMNALVLFSMIDNVDEVTFALRNSQSDGKLDQSKYSTTFTFPRIAFEERYGNLSVLGNNVGLLQQALTGKMNSSNDEFTEEEISAAHAVVVEYFRAIAAKEDKAILQTLTPKYNRPNVVLYGQEVRTLLSVGYDMYDPMRESYVKSGAGSIIGSKIENVIVFKVSFNVKYPQGTTGSFEEGDYKNWSMILIRDDKSSPWKIDDQGY